MGYQQGTLLKEDIIKSYNAWFSKLEKNGVTKQDLLNMWNQSKENIPQCYIDEVQGISDGAEIPFEDVASIVVIGVGLYTSNKCSFFSAWGNATKNGDLYHVQSYDLGLDLKDPDTDTYESNRQIIVVRTPDVGYDTVSLSLPGCICIEGGMNERQIVISYTNIESDDCSINGVPLGLRERMVLDNADSYLDAVDIMIENKVCGKNILISDGKIPLSVVVELDGKDSYVSTWDDEVEDTYPSEIINNVLRRSNFYLNYSIAGLEDDCYKKSTFFRFLLYRLNFDIKCYYFYTMLHFKVLSNEIKRNMGDFDHNLSINVLRDVYSGKTNLFYGLMNLLGGSYKNSWSQLSICPNTGDIIISIAKDGVTSFKQDLNWLNFDEIVNNPS